MYWKKDKKYNFLLFTQTWGNQQSDEATPPPAGGLKGPPAGFSSYFPVKPMA